MVQTGTKHLNYSQYGNVWTIIVVTVAIDIFLYFIVHHHQKHSFQVVIHSMLVDRFEFFD